MALHSDQVIGNFERAVAAVGAGEGYLIVHRDGIDVRDGVDKQGWHYTILDQNAHTLEEGNDLFTPMEDGRRRESDALKALNSLVSFLLACGESDGDGENASLFTSPVKDWVEFCDGDLQVLSLELETLGGS